MGALASAVAAGCSSAPPPAEAVGTTAEAIVNGTDSTVSQNFTVLLVHPTSSTEAYECSGILVAPNLVLTARHCVSATADKAFSCDSMGHGTKGGAIMADFAPSTILVFGGLDRPTDMAAPNAVGTQIFHDGATNLCNHDVALVALDQPLTGFPIATLRFDAALSSGDVITAVGWGVSMMSISPAVRQQRTDIAIRHVGPFAGNGGEDVPPNEFDVGESICEGDSGSPALDATGAVIGVASRGGNNLIPNPNDLAASCLGANSENFYSQVSAFKDVIEGAFNAVGAKPVVTSGGLLGDTCTVSTTCSSGHCFTGMVGGYCTQACDPMASSPCPSGYSCKPEGSGSLCVNGGGCSVADVGKLGETSGAAHASAAALGLLLAWRRRRGRIARQGVGTTKS